MTQELGYVDLKMLKDTSKTEEEDICGELGRKLEGEFLLPTRKRFIHALAAARSATDPQTAMAEQAAELRRVQEQQDELAQQQQMLAESVSQPSSPEPREKVTPRRTQHRTRHAANKTRERRGGGGGSPMSEGTPSPGARRRY